jgi:DDE domain
VYRAVDQFGQVIDVFVSPRRDARAARRFSQQASESRSPSVAELPTIFVTPYVFAQHHSLLRSDDLRGLGMTSVLSRQR